MRKWMSMTWRGRHRRTSRTVGMSQTAGPSSLDLDEGQYNHLPCIISTSTRERTACNDRFSLFHIRNVSSGGRSPKPKVLRMNDNACEETIAFGNKG